MSPNQWQEPDQWLETLPKNIAAASALFTDRDGRILLVKPSYRDHWLTVGGQLDEGETPEQACRREVKEEIGLDVELGDLLLVDWGPPTQARPIPIIVFLFDGGIIESDQIQLDGDELDEYRFVSPDQALPLLSSNGRRRLPAALEALRTGTTLYLSGSS